MVEQHAEIDRVRSERADIVVLHGAELNIAPDGSVDYDPEFLEMLDIAVASVHSHFDLDEVEQTARLITATENPAVSIIGHPTGRLIGRRPAIRFDVDAVLEAAAATGTIIEINSSLQRLDLPATFLRRAVGVDGVRFAISTDSHHTASFVNVQWGVALARKGWVTVEKVVNSLPKDEFLASMGL